MATALTFGRIYFIESDAGNQDWITNNAGDPDAIDLDNFTEGLDYIRIVIPRGFTRSSFTGALVTPTGGGKSFDQRNAARFTKLLQRGFTTTLAIANLIDKFIMSDRHTSGAIAVFKRYYAIAYFGTNNHLEFTDPSDNRKSYCKGIILSGITQWLATDSLDFLVRINWDSVW